MPGVGETQAPSDPQGATELLGGRGHKQNGGWLGEAAKPPGFPVRPTTPIPLFRGLQTAQFSLF